MDETETTIELAETSLVEVFEVEANVTGSQESYDAAAENENATITETENKTNEQEALKYVPEIVERFGQQVEKIIYKTDSNVDSIGKIQNGEVWYKNPLTGEYESGLEAAKAGIDFEKEYQEQKLELLATGKSIHEFMFEGKVNFLVQELVGNEVKSYHFEVAQKEEEEDERRVQLSDELEVSSVLDDELLKLSPIVTLEITAEEIFGTPNPDIKHNTVESKKMAETIAENKADVRISQKDFQILKSQDNKTLNEKIFVPEILAVDLVGTHQLEAAAEVEGKRGNNIQEANKFANTFSSTKESIEQNILKIISPDEFVGIKENKEKNILEITQPDLVLNKVQNPVQPKSVLETPGQHIQQDREIDNREPLLPRATSLVEKFVANKESQGDKNQDNILRQLGKIDLNLPQRDHKATQGGEAIFKPSSEISTKTGVDKISINLAQEKFVESAPHQMTAPANKPETSYNLPTELLEQITATHPSQASTQPDTFEPALRQEFESKTIEPITAVSEQALGTVSISKTETKLLDNTNNKQSDNQKLPMKAPQAVESLEQSTQQSQRAPEIAQPAVNIEAKTIIKPGEAQFQPQVGQTQTQTNIRLQALNKFISQETTKSVQKEQREYVAGTNHQVGTRQEKRQANINPRPLTITPEARPSILLSNQKQITREVKPPLPIKETEKAEETHAPSRSRQAFAASSDNGRRTAPARVIEIINTLTETAKSPVPTAAETGNRAATMEQLNLRLRGSSTGVDTDDKSTQTSTSPNLTKAA